MFILKCFQKQLLTKCWQERLIPMLPVPHLLPQGIRLELLPSAGTRLATPEQVVPVPNI